MFPLPWNKAYRKKDGSLTTVDDAISTGGTPYELPTASANTKGGVKIGNRLTITDGVLSADAQLPSSASGDAGKVLTVGNDGTPGWDTGGGGSSIEYRAGVQVAYIGAGSWNNFSINFSSAMPNTDYSLSLYSTDSNDKMLLSGITKTINGVTGRVDNADGENAHTFLINYIAIAYN